MPTENMTIEESIKRLEAITEEIYTWREELGEKLSERDRADINAYKSAIKALEKQMPKKPIEANIDCNCPICGWEYLTDELYCPNCGQALKWED